MRAAHRLEPEVMDGTTLYKTETLSSERSNQSILGAHCCLDFPASFRATELGYDVHQNFGQVGDLAVEVITSRALDYAEHEADAARNAVGGLGDWCSRVVPLCKTNNWTNDSSSE